MITEGEATTQLFNINAGVPQGSETPAPVCLLFTSDLPTSNDIDTFADDTAVLASAYNPTLASKKLQNHLNSISVWLKQWRIKANKTKSIRDTFSLRRQECPSVSLNNIEIRQSNTAKYLGVHLDKKLTWKNHIFSKRKALTLQSRKFYSLLNNRSSLSLNNKLTIYKSILKPIWTYGPQLL